MRLIAFLLLVVCQLTVAQATRPNFVVVLADDLGFGDLGCYGSDSILSPRIDQFTPVKALRRLPHC